MTQPNFLAVGAMLGKWNRDANAQRLTDHSRQQL